MAAKLNAGAMTAVNRFVRVSNSVLWRRLDLYCRHCAHGAKRWLLPPQLQIGLVDHFSMPPKLSLESGVMLLQISPIPDGPALIIMQLHRKFY